MFIKVTCLQLKNQDVDWRLPTEFNVKYTDMAGELVVGGVFLRHFIKQPSWGVRKPRDFMSALFDVRINLYFETLQT